LQLQPCEHEQHQVLPAVEAQVLGQCRDMLKEGIAAGEGGAKKGAALVFELQHRVEQKRRDVQRQQRLRQIPFTVPEVVLEVIPLGDIFVWVATLSRLVILYKTPCLLYAVHSSICFSFLKQPEGILIPSFLNHTQ